MHNSRIKRITVAVCLAFMPFAATAAGLGKLTIISSLGQPLNAEVELLSATKEELSSLTARIAPNSVYVEQGIERASTLSAVRVELASRADGVPVLKITSSQSINDPFLDMLVQVEWSSGSLLREYTALLDPPGFGDQPQTTAVVEAKTQSQTEEQPTDQTVAATPASGKKGRAHKAAITETKSSTEQAQDAAPAVEHTVKAGDTLGGVASKLKQSQGVSLDQMLVGLYRANPDAFIGNNMNRLKVGQIVRQPSAEELQAVSPQDASKEVRMQAADWNSYRSKLASAVAESAPAKDEASRQGASGKITAPVEDKGSAPTTGPRDVVKLSKGTTVEEKAGAAESSKVDTNTKGSKSGSKDGTLQEEVTAREKAIKEANERVAILEKQVQELKQLLEMKNQSLADMQKSATAKTAEPAKPPVTKPEPVATTPAPGAKPEVAKAEEAKPVETKAEVKPEEKAATEKPKPKKVVPPPPLPQQTLLGVAQGFVQDNLPLLGALLLALGAGGWLAKRRKKKTGADVAGSDATSVAPSAAASSIMADFQQAEREEMIDNNDVDPISVAEGYMAYGRDTQAEEVLKEAIRKEPNRYELHSKLLEIFAERKDESAFGKLAEQLQDELGADAPVVRKAVELGRKLEPNNPRYSVEPTSQDTSDFEGTQLSKAADDDELQLPTDTTLDFSLDTSAVELPQEAPAGDATPLDFDMGAFGGGDEVEVLEMPNADVPTSETAAQPSFLESVGELDVLPDLASTATPSLASEQADDTTSLEFALDLPEPAAADNAQLDAADLGLPDLGMPELGAPETPTAEEPLPELADSPEFAEPEMDEPNLEAPELSAPEMALPDISDSQDETPEYPAIEPEPEPEKKPRRRKGKKAAEEEVVSSDETDAGFDALPELEDSTLADGSLDDMMLELPEMATDEVAEDLSADIGLTAPAEGMDGMDLVLPELEEPAVEAPLVMETAQDELPDMSFDLPEAGELADVEATPEVAGMTVEETEPEAEEIMIEAVEPVPAVNKGLVVEEIAFDMPVEEVPASIAMAAPEVDFSGIDLDMGKPKPVAQVVHEIEEEIVLSAAAESADVDTKLDLVTAYLDMGDKEGARELLQEVLDEGGPKQKERAQKILGTLD